MSADTHKDLKVKLETFTKSELIGALMRVAELSALKAGGWGVSEMKFARKLCSAERDRMTAAEICIDELLTIMDRHGASGSYLHSALTELSSDLNNAMLAADGLAVRRERLSRVRRALTDAFPMTDDDLAATALPPAERKDQT